GGTLLVRRERSFSKKQADSYICHTAQKYATDCRGVAISSRILDQAVWKKVEGLLTRPETIADELDRMEAEDPTLGDLAAVDRRLAQIQRQQANLVEQL